MLMTSDNIKRCSSGECKNVRQIHGMSRMYIQNLIKDFAYNLDFTPVFNCDNKKIQRVVEIAVSKIGCITEEKQLNFHINYDGTRINVEEALGMENPYHYRNKAQYPVGIDKNGKPVIGVFAKRTHEIIPMEECLIQNKETEKLAKFVFDFITKNNISIYDEKTGKGLVRHIVTKIGIKNNEIIAKYDWSNSPLLHALNKYWCFFTVTLFKIW